MENMAFPERKEPKNMCMKHNKIKGLIKCFQWLENIFVQQINFLGTPKYLWGSTIIFQAGI